MTEPSRRRPAISAHRGRGGDAAEGSYEAYRAAAQTGADYVEFDARRTADGALVACHRARFWPGGRQVAALSYARLCRLAGHDVPRIGELLRLLAGRAAAHVDLKDSASAAEVAAEVLRVLPPADVIMTTRDQAAALALRIRHPDLPVGLTVGGDTAEALRFAVHRARTPGLSRLQPVLEVNAQLAVLHYRAARPGLLAECRRRGIRAMVWTVNSDAALTRWLRRDIDVLVTDRPARAVALRAEA
jgi:glycerophosphoryl diester phosphodiesterase